MRRIWKWRGPIFGLLAWALTGALALWYLDTHPTP